MNGDKGSCCFSVSFTVNLVNPRLINFFRVIFWVYASFSLKSTYVVSKLYRFTERDNFRMLLKMHLVSLILCSKSCESASVST